MNSQILIGQAGIFRHRIFAATRVKPQGCNKIARIIRQAPRISPLVANNSASPMTQRIAQSQAPQALRKSAVL